MSSRLGEAYVVIVGRREITREWFVYDYFDRTRELDLARFPTAERTRELLEAAGFARCTTEPVERISITMPARHALDSGAVAKASTSQLALLSDVEYEAGIAKIERASEAASQRSEVLELHAELVLHGHSGVAN